MLDVSDINQMIEMAGVMLCVVGLICNLQFKSMDWQSRKGFSLMFVFAAIQLFGDAIADVYRGLPGFDSRVIVYLSNFSSFAAGFMLAGAFTTYFTHTLEREGDRLFKIWRTIVWSSVAVMIMLLFISQFNGMFYIIDENNLYHRSPSFFVMTVYGILVQLANLYILGRYYHRVNRVAFCVFLAYLLAPVIALVIQTYVYGFALTYFTMTICALVMFFTMEVEIGKRTLRQQAKLREQELDLAESRTQVMMSQIQPHFLYNSLDTIYYLCGKDPEKAQIAVGEFSEYLRGNLGSLTQKTPIPIEKELSHVKTYLDLEKMSSDDTLDFEFDIQAGGFNVPALSVQTLVENAVRHGVNKKVDGGTVWISTRDAGDHCEVVIKDDGVGFDTSLKPDESRPHIGLESTKKRLSAMCDGSFTIESTIGQGTTATVTVPKKEA